MYYAPFNKHLKHLFINDIKKCINKKISKQASPYVSKSRLLGSGNAYYVKYHIQPKNRKNNWVRSVAFSVS
ncbi:hypothetical protein DUD79_29585 [Priestia aryabhattai]